MKSLIEFIEENIKGDCTILIKEKSTIGEENSAIAVIKKKGNELIVTKNRNGNKDKLHNI